MSDEASTIRVYNSTKDKLDAIRRKRGESYEDIILRLIQEQDEPRRREREDEA